MANRTFAFGDSLAGIVIDGQEATPYVTGTLTYEEHRGIRLAVPFMNTTSVAQFGPVIGWFKRGGRPPSSLLVQTQDGDFSLHGCRTSFSAFNYGGSGLSVGHIAAKEVVYKERDGEFSDELTVAELRSHIDGLTEWTDLQATTYSVVRDEQHRVQKIIVDVESKEPFSWSHGDVTFTLSTDWKTEQSEPGLRIREWVCLTTTFPEPRPCSEHIREQRKMVSLLTLMYGTAVAFRRHEIRDARFNSKVLTGKIVDTPFFEMVSEDTVDDFSRPSTNGKLKDPLVHASKLDGEALIRWGDAQETWNRVIQPTVGTIRRSDSYLEDHVVNSSMSLEAAGSLLGVVDDEEQTYGRRKLPITATYVYRCLKTLGLDWSEAATSSVALARAVANNYNEIKHFDRGEFPPAEQTYLVGQVALLIVRLLAVRILDPTLELVHEYGTSWQFEALKREFRDRNVYVDEQGIFADYPDEKQSAERA